MLEYLINLKRGTANKQQIIDVLEHPDYDFEFRRYGVVSKENLIGYFWKLMTIKEADIPSLSLERSSSLRNKHLLWLKAYNEAGQFRSLYEDMKRLFANNGVLDKINARIRAGIPDDVDIGKIKIISTMSIGPSFGYVFEQSMHIDLLGIGKYCMLESLPIIIAHEIHHIVMLNYVSGFMNDFSLEERYIFSFSGEGLAIKFCNNAQGVISRAIYEDSIVNEGLDSFSMEYLNAHFREIFGVFSNTLKEIRAGKVTNADIDNQYNEYWWNPYLNGQSHHEAPQLLQSRIYSLGNELFGAIYDGFGLQVLFECVRHPLKTMDYFKCAVEKAGIKYDAFISD